MLTMTNHPASCRFPAVDAWGVCQNCFVVVDPERAPDIPSPERWGEVRVRAKGLEGDLPMERAVDRGLSEVERGMPAEPWEELDR